MWNWIKNIIKAFSRPEAPTQTSAVATIIPVSAQAHVSTPSIVVATAPQLKPARTKKESTSAKTAVAETKTTEPKIAKKPIRRTAKRTPTKKPAA